MQTSLDGVTDIHIHTAPDIKPRLESDIETALNSREALMKAIVLKSHCEPTSGRAKIASEITGFPVFGGVVLNESVGGLNLDAVKTCVAMGGKFVWFPTTSVSSVKFDIERVEEIIHIIADNNMVLSTGHLKPEQIFTLIDVARSHGIWKIVVNHPFANVVSATFDEQMEMSKYAFLEHCFVTCMSQHQNLDPVNIRDSINMVSPDRCIMATDFGQPHNPSPSDGMKQYIKILEDLGVKKSEIHKMSVENPGKLIYK
jgi:hypothetical protein